MPLFGRKSAPPATPPAPDRIVVTDADFAAAPELFRRFEDSQITGSDATVRYAALSIAIAAGMPPLEEMMRQSVGGKDPDLDRPWRWLVALATEAQRRGDFDLVAHLCFFSHFWATSLAPHMTLADQMDTRLCPPPPDQLAHIYAIGLSCMRQLDPQHLLVNQDGVQIDVLTVSVLVAREVPALAQWLPPEVVELAARHIQ